MAPIFEEPRATPCDRFHRLWPVLFR
jgi:hypothetical protein